MNDLVKQDLSQEVQTPFQQQMLFKVRNLVDMSRRYMCTFYDRWDQNHIIYRGIIPEDVDDREAENKGEPTKMVIPAAFSQIDTFVSFGLALYLQRKHVFDLIPTAVEHVEAAKLAMAVLDRDLRHNSFELILRQFLLDIARFGVAPLKIAWTTEKRMKNVTRTIPMAAPFVGAMLGNASITTREMVVDYQGNRIVNISPYRFFPDPRVPFTRMQEGEFVGSEEYFTLPALQQMQVNGDITGVEWIKPLGGDALTERLRNTRVLSTLMNQDSPLGAIGSAMPAEASMYILTECQISIIPSQWEVNGKPLGPENYPVKYNIWYVNDQRMVKCEPLGYDHNQFTYAVGEYSPDMHDLASFSISENVGVLQSVMTWFINSHIASVRKIVSDRLVVDPTMVEYSDLEEHRSVIRMKPEATGMGADKAVQQLRTMDVTANHVTDAEMLSQWIRITTGISDNALGQYFTGRRTAEESRNANSGTSARLKSVFTTIFRAALEPLGRQMIANCQQLLDYPQLVRIAGSDPKNLKAFQNFVQVSKGELHGEYDFEVFDGTLPSERGQQAAALGDFLMALLKNPQIAISTGYDIKKILAKWLTLRGIRYPEQYELDQVRQQQMYQELVAVGIAKPPEPPNAAQQNGKTNPTNGGPATPASNPGVATRPGF